MTGYARIDMDSVATLMPGDKVSGRVSARGEHFDWTPQPDVFHTSEPIPTRATTISECLDPNFVNLAGKMVGRFTVMGISEFRTSNGQNWSVRCVCGSYETKKAKTIKAWIAGDIKGDHEPMCGWCSNNRRLQLGRYDDRKEDAAAKSIMEAAR